LLFKTIDGNDISLDVIIAYRIDPKKAPYILQFVRVEKNKSAQRAAKEEYNRKLEEAKGEVNKMIADVDGEFLKAQIDVDAHFEKQKLIAEAIKTEGIATAKGIQEMNKAMEGSGGEALVKLRIAEALQDKRIILLPVSEGGMNLKTTDINQLINTMGIKSLSSR